MKTGLLRVRQESIGLIVGFATMGRVFTETNKREGTVDGTGAFATYSEAVTAARQLKGRIMSNCKKCQPS